MRTLLAASLLAIAVPSQQAVDAASQGFRPMHLFGDHMVLPRGVAVPIRGFGAAGAAVEVKGSWGASATTTVDTAGRWTAALTTPATGGPFEVTLHSAGTSLVLHDVLIGDVWLGSGQSNMEMPVGEYGGWRGGVLDFAREIASAQHPDLRVFTTVRTVSGVPLDDLAGEWQVCSPQTAATFSATAYFFGRELLAHGKGPIGLVVSSWGGTICEAWASEGALHAFPEFAAALAATKPTRGAPSVEQRRAAFWAAVPETPAAHETKQVEMPDLWSRSGLGNFDGVAFYHRTLALPATCVGKELWLELGAIDDMDTVWCNGTRIGGMEADGLWSTPRRYRVPAELTRREGGIDLLVRVVDTGGEGGFSAAASQLRLELALDASTTVPLAGTWTRTLGPAMHELPEWPRDADGNPNRPAVLWNAMIAPLVPFPFTGAIWYQGESNRDRAEQYARLFPAMIADWRRAFASELPFYFVQIAPYTYGPDDGLTAPLRQAQAAALDLPHTGMVVTLDIGDARDIHPKDKQSVGKRLAWHALRDHYGEQVVADGPHARGVSRDGAAVRIEFDGCDGGLQSDGAAVGFEIAGADGVFRAAKARLDGTAVVLECSEVPLPVEVRYAWAGVPQCSLHNGAGLPAWPLRLPVK